MRISGYKLKQIRNFIAFQIFARLANFVMLVVLAVFCFIFYRSLPFLTSNISGDSNNAIGLERIIEVFTSGNWFPNADPPAFGMLSLFYGSFIVTIMAMIFAIPISILSSVVLSDIVPFRVRQMLKPFIELPAAIPSVAFGFFAIKIVAPFLQDTFGFTSGTNVLNASLILAIMAIPTIVSVTEDATSGVGREIREASYALGATRAETIIKVVFPAAWSGIAAAVILGIMRAIGETMVVWMAAGNAANMPTAWYRVDQVITGLGDAVRTMTATIAGDIGETPADSLHRSALFTVGLILLLFTLAMNLLTEIIVNRGKLKPDQNKCNNNSENKKLQYCFFLVIDVVRKIFYFLINIFCVVCCLIIFPLQKIVSCLFFSWFFKLFRFVFFETHASLQVSESYFISLQDRSLNNNRQSYLRFMRNLFDCGFTFVSLLSILILFLAIGIVIVPIFRAGFEAVCFQETVEHRLFILEKFQRGNRQKIEEEFHQCSIARKPVYDKLKKLSWLAPDDWIAQSSKLARNTDNRKLNRAFRNLCDASSTEELNVVYEKIKKIKQKQNVTEIIDPIIHLADEYYSIASHVDLSVRHKLISSDSDLTYSTAFKQIRTLINGVEGTGCILGMESREGNSHLPPEVRYGAAHWSTAQKFLAQLKHTTLWKPKLDNNNFNTLINEKIVVDRASLFEGTEIEADVRSLIDEFDCSMDKMLNPCWTFYGFYFFDSATAGHYLGGVGPELLGTTLISLFSILISLPLGLLTAAYLVEAAKDTLVTQLMRLCINTLAGVPSVVFGLFGLAVIVEFITGKPSLLAGSITL
ncbi:MAG: phosphate ABC transporter permease subunit PstC, partial [Planctomycetaceae bacterium]|nr:phosphate ABC transporter permease subunit PstC [Planctomycetaceae bacterium]